MKAITAESRAAAWVAAAQYLTTCDDFEDYNVVLEITNPMRRNSDDRRVEERVDAFLRAAGHYPLETVAETIFPAGEYRRHGPTGVYETYPKEIYPAIKSLPELRWGTYAHRLVRRRGAKGEFNPLKFCIEKMQREFAGRSTKTACYELSLSDVNLDLPLYEPASDRKHLIGGPCLSHVSLKIMRNERIALTALYRSHYYVQKALGNLLGLARLQAFVCEQTKLPPGPLACVSTYATLERKSKSWNRKAILALIAELSQPGRTTRGAKSNFKKGQTR
jgi:hypothetical protein